MRSPLAPSVDLARLPDRIRNGDPAAEDELVREFGERVQTFLTVRTRDRELARDLGQDVMISVISALRRGQLREPDRLGAYVYGTARNVLNNYLRTGRREPLEPLDTDVAAVARDPADVVEASQRRTLVRKALAGLSRSDRGILLLTLVDGLKPGEIAHRLGLSAEVVRVRKSRALKRVVGRIQDLL